jgi:CRP/FNR family transcriptional regulator
MAGTVGAPGRPALYRAILPVMVPLLAILDPARRDRLLAAAPVRTVDAGTVVAVRGEPATALILVETGGLTAVHETAGGQRRRLGEFPAPCAVDKAAVLDGGGHTATWLATARSRLRLVPAAELLALLDVPAARRHILTHLASRLREQQDDLVAASYSDVPARVAAWLVRAASTNGTRVLLPGAQQGLAESIGATRVTVNRALRSLAEDGLITVEPGAITIETPELLAHRAWQSGGRADQA